MQNKPIFSKASRKSHNCFLSLFCITNTMSSIKRTHRYHPDIYYEYLIIWSPIIKLNLIEFNHVSVKQYLCAWQSSSKQYYTILILLTLVDLNGVPVPLIKTALWAMLKHLLVQLTSCSSVTNRKSVFHQPFQLFMQSVHTHSNTAQWKTSFFLLPQSCHHCMIQSHQSHNSQIALSIIIYFLKKSYYLVFI